MLRGDSLVSLDQWLIPFVHLTESNNFLLLQRVQRTAFTVMKHWYSEGSLTVRVLEGGLEGRRLLVLGHYLHHLRENLGDISVASPDRGIIQLRFLIEHGFIRKWSSFKVKTFRRKLWQFTLMIVISTAQFVIPLLLNRWLETKVVHIIVWKSILK